MGILLILAQILLLIANHIELVVVTNAWLLWAPGITALAYFICLFVFYTIGFVFVRKLFR